MKTLKLCRVEILRLLKNKWTWIILVATLASNLLGYFIYRPLMSISPIEYVTSVRGTYIANPALAGGLSGAVIFGLWAANEFNRSKKNGVQVLLEAIISPNEYYLSKLLSMLCIAVGVQIINILVYLPYTLIMTKSVFSLKIYLASQFVFMLLPIVFALLLVATIFQITERADLSIIGLLALMALSLTAWKTNYLLRWVNPAVSILSDNFGNARLFQTVIQNRIFWMGVLIAAYGFSYLCIRRYKGSLTYSLKINFKKWPMLIGIVLCISLGYKSYADQPYLDDSVLEPKYEDYFNDQFVCEKIHVKAHPDIHKGRYDATALYTIKNMSLKQGKAVFKINPGYAVLSAEANGKKIDFMDRRDDEDNTKNIEMLLPADENIELKILFGGVPREWNILEEMQGKLEISEEYVYLAHQEIFLEPQFGYSYHYEDFEGSPFVLQVELDLPANLEPIMFGREKAQVKKVNEDGTKTWLLTRAKGSMVFYAGDYLVEKIDMKDFGLDFYYSRKHEPVMKKAQVNQMLKEVFQYCTAHYGALNFYDEKNRLKIIQVTAFQWGGYAAGGASVIDENSFNEQNLSDRLKGGQSSEVMAHEIIHQWWGLGRMFEAESPWDEWTSEGLTVYSTYRLMKSLYGEDYAQKYYVDVWKSKVEAYKQNFYTKNPEYLKGLPERYKEKVCMDVAQVKQYCLMPLKILKAEQLVGGEAKMDMILKELFCEEINPENPYLSYGAFLEACHLKEEDLAIE